MRNIRIIGFILLFAFYSNLSAQDFMKPSGNYRMPEGITQTDYLPGTVIFKMKPAYRESCNQKSITDPAFSNALLSLKFNFLEKKFPRHNPPKNLKNKAGLAMADLSLIYEMKFSENISVEQAVNKLLQTGCVEYAQPYYLPTVLYSPDDPMKSNQYAYRKMKADSAWNITQGDTTVTIGIIDTGTETDHPDLKTNLQYNYDDPIDGIDNDGDGYIDNFGGWDMAYNDNNPDFDYREHGIHVAGIAAAATDNTTGIVGIGFKCRYLPVKVEDSSGQFVNSYEGIVYAADHGCSIINCSWGSTYFQGNFGQDVITFASINCNSLVVAACGNNNNTAKFYPASYQYALSVAATDSNDVKWAGSSFYPRVDISAPGKDIYSTLKIGTYGKSSGTSMASPNVAGCAALVKSYFPSLTCLQIAEVLKVTADNIDTIPANAPYAGMLGSGRVNVYKALTTANMKSVRLTDVVPSDHENEIYQAGDTIYFTGTFTNYLDPLTNLSITISTASPLVSILNATSVIGPMASMTSATNASVPFRVKLLPTFQANLLVDFTVTFSDGTILGDDVFSFVFNKNYIDIDTNEVATTLCDNSQIGYSDIYQTQGLGFTLNEATSMLSVAGPVFGISSTQVSDCIYSGNVSMLNSDLIPKGSLTRLYPSTFADYEVAGVITDSASGANKINIMVTQRALAWNTAGNTNYIIFEYKIRNRNSTILNNFYAGLYADWDVEDYIMNHANWNASNRLGYIYYKQGGAYAGISMLSDGTASCYSFDNDGYFGSVKISDGFLKTEKYISFLSLREESGPMVGSYEDGNDVSHMVSSGPYSINPGDTITVAFAMIAGTSLSDLQLSAANAYTQYHTVPGIVETNNDNSVFVYPNPTSNILNIQWNQNENSNVRLTVYDYSGRPVYSESLKSVTGRNLHSINTSAWSGQLYFWQLQSSNLMKTGRFVVSH
ncbi:MAG: S8/S53 family peptidase [Bacteroidota bacterium]